jgi:hypothetical protein
MEIIDDFKEIQSLSEKSMILLVNEFNTNPLNSFGSIFKLEKICLDENIDKTVAKKFFGLLVFITDSIINEKNVSLGFKKFEEKVIHIFPEETKYVWDFIKNNFGRLEQFIIKRKEILLSDENDKIKGFNIICDVRPIYDIDRTKIEKYIFPLILSITSDENNKFVAEFYEEDLEKIKLEVDYAYKKLQIIKNDLKIS